VGIESAVAEAPHSHVLKAKPPNHPKLPVDVHSTAPLALLAFERRSIRQECLEKLGVTHLAALQQ
jgi:hypothetical protein